MNNYNYSIEEIEDMLNKIAESIPKVLYKNLHGGIVLIESAKIHPKSVQGDSLYIAGEYRRSKTGNLISIYYGSVMKTYGRLNKEDLEKQLEDILIHEFRHHIEYEAGDYSLVVEDKIYLRNYLERHNR